MKRRALFLSLTWASLLAGPLACMPEGRDGERDGYAEDKGSELSVESPPLSVSKESPRDNNKRAPKLDKNLDKNGAPGQRRPKTPRDRRFSGTGPDNSLFPSRLEASLF